MASGNLDGNGLVNAMVTGDFDGDGNLDVVLNGNEHWTDVSIGRYDALNGSMLKGDGKGGFTALSISLMIEKRLLS